ncbi:replication initiator [Longispora sp. NPDC051575]|uniref:replication initiator n=1 Tax=Longispora sp. NPDC051575 TaxID=3154943 RepID=UPI0034354C64
MVAPLLTAVPGTPIAVPGTAVSTGSPLYTREHVMARAGQGDYFEWLDHVWPAAGCAHPIRLHGQVLTLDARTGAQLSALHTEALPDGVIYKACGNRRAAVCPACSVVYRRDAFQLLRAGLVGGKSVPDTVSQHPAVFATFTAPSFGPVHTRHVRKHSCADKNRCGCRPEPCHARRDTPDCEHGQAAACFARHEHDDGALGHPLCLDCYDHDHQVVWNHGAGELWRRTKQHIERYLNRLRRRRGIPGKLAVSHGKAAEFQIRGAVHFHVLLRLDAVDPDDKTLVLPPPPGMTVSDIDDAVKHAAAAISYTTDTHPDRSSGWLIGWGRQVDVRVITLSGDNTVTDSMVAGYLAKYSTKGTESTGHSSRRLDGDTIGVYADPAGSHPARLIAACWRLGRVNAWTGLRRWAHMLGFGGHFLTKARRYSVTFAALRHARVTYRRSEGNGPEYNPIAAVEHVEEETTLIVGRLTYAGSGWRNTGDAMLANTAAALAREHQKAGREDLAHEEGTHA